VEIGRSGARAAVATKCEFERAPGEVCVPGVMVHPHAGGVRAAGLPFEFVFFNTALPEGRANRSKKPIAVVEREVAAIMARFDLLAPLRKAPSGWRQALKDCYVRHFGSSGLERNNISLCLMARPLVTHELGDCGWFHEHELVEPAVTATEIPFEHDRQSLLLTGDLTMNPAVIAEMRSHFRDWRWLQLGVTQVPHHGSRHSWAPGNASLFPGPQFVHCVPDKTARHPAAHPHPTVDADLAHSVVHHATYGRTVLHTYHFDT